MQNTTNSHKGTSAPADNYLTPTYARDQFTQPNNDLQIEQGSKDPRAVQQNILNRIDLDARNSSDLGSYICDYMDPECDEIVKRTIGKVYIDHSEYPQTSALGDAVPAMIQHWYNGTPLSEEGKNNGKIIGTVTIGSSEAIMLGLMAHRQNWYNKWLAKYGQFRGASYDYHHDRPLLMYARDVHTCWDKYSLYYNVPALVFDLEEDEYLLDPAKVKKYLSMTLTEIVEAIDTDPIAKRFWDVLMQELRLFEILEIPEYKEYAERKKLGDLVCCVGGVIGTTFTGQGDDIQGLNDALEGITTDTGYEIPIHVDAASGGFVVPFTNPGEKSFKWTFSLPRVKSINVSNHKFGMVYPGCGTVVFSDENVVPEELIYRITYLGGNFTDYTVNFSRGSAMVLAAYYNLKRFGLDGFEKLNTQCVQNAGYLASKIAAVKNKAGTALFEVISDYKHYPMTIWHVKKGLEVKWTLTQLSNVLEQSGWKLPAYQLPFTSSHKPDGTWVMRVVTRQDISAEKIDVLVGDIQAAVLSLDEYVEDLLQANADHVLTKQQERLQYIGSGSYRH